MLGFGHTPADGDPAGRRNRMVEDQIAARGACRDRILEALRAVPRHAFIPAQYEDRAYGDHPVPIGHGQTISQPYIVALMTDLLDPRSGDRVLEIGTGSGYQAAILSMLCAEVISVERHPELAEAARARLIELGYANVSVHLGDGTRGWPDKAPYDGILVTAAGPAVPESLKRQLAVGGRLVCPVGSRERQQLVVVARTEDGFQERTDTGCIFVPLIGDEGWPS